MNNFKKTIDTAQDVKLSPNKKESIRMRVQNFMEMTPVKTQKPQALKSRRYISQFSVLNFSKAVSFALIVLIAGGSTISYASEDTLPGDTFYTVKVKFTEPIQESLAFSQEAKLQVKTKQVEKRLTEAQTLLEKNDTTPEKHAEVSGLVEKQIGEINLKIDELQEKGDVEAILNTTSKLQPVLKAHREALEEISKNSEATELSEAIVKEEQPEITELPSDEKPDDFVEHPDSEEPQVQEMTIQAKTTIEVKDRSKVADDLLKTVEKTIVEVEAKETKALEKAQQIEKEGGKINEVTTKKVEEALKEINDAKEIIEKENIQNDVPDNEDFDLSLDSSISTMNENLKSDLRILIVTEAEILLEESKHLYDQGLYKQALEKAQQALKLTEEMEATKRIEKLRASIQNIELESREEISLETQVDVEAPTLPTEEELKNQIQSIPLQDQASKAIETLEAQLVSFNQ